MQTYINNQWRPAVKHRTDFQSYLERSQFDPFTLDLRDKTLMEVIEADIQAKSKRSPNYRKHLSCLINNLKELEKVYHTTLKPVQITDIFWDYFVAFCDEKYLKASTTLTLVNQLRSVLNWAVKHCTGHTDLRSLDKYIRDE